MEFNITIPERKDIEFRDKIFEELITDLDKSFFSILEVDIKDKYGDRLTFAKLLKNMETQRRFGRFDFDLIKNFINTLPTEFTNAKSKLVKAIQIFESNLEIVENEVDSFRNLCLELKSILEDKVNKVNELEKSYNDLVLEHNNTINDLANIENLVKSKMAEKLFVEASNKELIKVIEGAVAESFKQIKKPTGKKETSSLPDKK